MDKREWLAHRALRATLDALREPNNPKVVARMQDATSELCPFCEHGIQYCRCFEYEDSAILSMSNEQARQRGEG